MARPAPRPAAPGPQPPSGLRGHGRGRFAPFVIGNVLLFVGLMAAALAAYGAAIGEPVAGLLALTAVAGAVGATLRRFGRTEAEPGRREAIATVLLTWLAAPLVGTVPYLVTAGLPFTQALFESVSGFTSTGATVITTLEALPRSLLLWRAATQWLGGVGIIVLFVAVFPQLSIAGRQMFFRELPGVSEERLTPRLRSTAVAVLSVYTGLTAACTAAFALRGMPFSEALGHALATVSAGGFAMHADGLAHYADPAVEWTAAGFMLVAGVSMPLLWRAVTGRPSLLLRNREVRAYLAVAAASATALAVLLRDESGAEALRHGVFHAVSVVTTTGFATADFAAWAEPAQAVLLALMLVGGSTGSASGGVKVLRWLIIAKNTVREVRRVIHPRAVLPVRVGSSVMPEEVLRAVAAFITLYVGLVMLATLTLVMLGAPFVEAFTGALACVGNVGPGFGTFGPYGSYADLHPAAHLVLSFAMYAGRLEVVTVFVVFMPSWWRLPRHTPLTRRLTRR